MLNPERNLNNPAEKAFARDQQPDNKTIGPNAPAKFDPYAFKNVWVSSLFGDNPPAKKFSDQAFSAQSADEFQNRMASLTDTSNFKDPGDTRLADDFLQKYVATNLLGDDEKVNKQSVAFLQTQQPSEGVGLGKAKDRMEFAGDQGTAVG